MPDTEPGGDDGLAAQLARWAADAASAQAVGSRTVQRWLRQQEEESTNLHGVLVDVAERGVPVAVSTASSSWTGLVEGVGPDFCVVGSTRSSTVVALAAVVGVSPAGPGRSAPSVGERAAPLQIDLSAVLGLLCADRSPVHLTVRGGQSVTGTLVAAGTDVVAVRSDTHGRRTITVVTAAIEACTPT